MPVKQKYGNSQIATLSLPCHNKNRTFDRLHPHFLTAIAPKIAKLFKIYPQLSSSQIVANIHTIRIRNNRKKGGRSKQVYTKALPERDYTTLSRNYRELRAQGNNLNQIARALNTAQLAGDRVNLDVRDVEAAIASISLTTQIIRTAMR